VVFKEPEPRATRPRGSGSTAGATPPAKKPIGDASGSDSIAIAAPSAGVGVGIGAGAASDQNQNQNRTSDDPSSDPASASLVERFVHWYGNEGARAPDRRRRRRHERSQTPVPGSRPHDRAGARERREFHHPIVGGPGFGDPLKMAADKLAYARALGPAALSYLAGFAPGDAGWRGDEGGNGGNGGDGGGVVAMNASKPADGPISGGGVEPVGDGAAPRGSAASVGAAFAGASSVAGSTAGASGSRYPPRNPDPVPATATAAIDFGYGLDPRAFAFDPLDPAPPPQPVAKVSGGSEVDGQQSSYVTTGDANADADAAGEAGSVGGGSALGDTAEGSAGEAGAAVTATATSANDAGDDAGANKRKRESE
jgi:RAT1-interacting protein